MLRNWNPELSTMSHLNRIDDNLKAILVEDFNCSKQKILVCFN